MIPKLMDRLAKLEAGTSTPSAGRHLVFRIEAPHGTPTAEIVAFLRRRGHAIDDADDVLVMNLGAHGMAEGEAIRDLSPSLLTEEARAAAPAAGRWPKAVSAFTFNLDSPRGAR